MTDHNAPTPRTDAKSFYADQAHPTRQCVLAGFARELERELAALSPPPAQAVDELIEFLNTRDGRCYLEHGNAIHKLFGSLSTALQKSEAEVAALKHDAAKRSETQREGK